MKNPLTGYLVLTAAALLVSGGISILPSHAQYGQQDEGFAGIDDPRQADLERPSNAQDGLEVEEDDPRQRSLEQGDGREEQIQSPSGRQDELEEGDRRQYELEH